jgi:dihydroorotate dehydrogenase electron transfer subunit
MTKQIAAPVVSRIELMPGVYLFWLRAPQIAEVAQPGQFVMVRCGDGHQPLLRRPLSIHRIAGGEQIALLFSVVGQGTSLLSQYGEGDKLDLLGPLGNGFSLHPDSGKLLLVAGGVGIAPLVFLADKVLEQGRAVVLLAGSATASLLYPWSLLPSAVDLVTATEDGSEGREGMVTDFLAEFVNHADQVFACGPQSMYQVMAGRALHGPKSVQTAMACGLGACYGCTVKTKRGLQQVCRDGPVFELDDILW